MTIFYSEYSLCRFTNCINEVKIFISIIQSIIILLKFRPDVVLGMGGFTAGPVGIAAWILRFPLVIHEQNAIAGFTNRVLSVFSKKVLLATDFYN